MTHKQLFAILGFGFGAVWIGLDFGDAILCLLVAAIFYALGSFVQGEFDLADIQDRLHSGRSDTPAPSGARRPTRIRVR
jgi:hypothetical protein